MTAPQHITIIGAMGTGKTTVARLVAARLGWDAVDADDLIVATAGLPMQRLFAEEGELAFRQREAALFAALAGRNRVVVAAGGGAPVFAPTRRAIVEAGLVVCLSSSAGESMARLDARNGHATPMLDGQDPLVRARRLLDQRAAVFDRADFALPTDILSAEEAAGEVVRLYETYGERAFSRPGRGEELARDPSILPPVVDAPGAATVVRTASGEYPAYVDWGALDRLGDYVKRATGARRAFMVSDDHVLSLWGEPALASLRAAGLDCAIYVLPPGDGSKSIANTAQVYDWLASHRAERRDAVVALGGGMVDDFAGFVAGTYLRGMPVVQVPTSLLAMVDASIGGKTAVNHAGAKNIVGLFYQPRAVVADVATLQTLPRRELVEGLGEVIKHAFIRDAALLETLETRLDDLLALEPALTTEIIRRNVQIKAAVVSEDERETGGLREILNFGHTLGHAFEAAGGYEALLHGEAVGAGMVAAARIGARVGVTPQPLVDRLERLVGRAGLPLRPPPGLDRARIRGALALDKKVVAGGQRWVLLQDVGRTVVRDDVPTAVIESVLDELLA